VQRGEAVLFKGTNGAACRVGGRDNRFPIIINSCRASTASLMRTRRRGGSFQGGSIESFPTGKDVPLIPDVILNYSKVRRPSPQLATSEGRGEEMDKSLGRKDHPQIKRSDLETLGEGLQGGKKGGTKNVASGVNSQKSKGRLASGLFIKTNRKLVVAAKEAMSLPKEKQALRVKGGGEKKSWADREVAEVGRGRKSSRGLDVGLH